jgi:hypothetical protein
LTSHESRLLPALAVLTVPIFLAFLPGRYLLMPKGIPILAGASLAISMLATGFFPASVLLRSVERYTALVILPLAMGVQVVLVAALLIDMAKPHSGFGGLTLLTTSVAIWANNIILFALAYWQLDRGGPTGRTTGSHGRADFTFPRGDPSDGVPTDWQPVFANYFYLAFNTATAFSPTDVLPLTPRAKMLMMTESFISLLTVVAIGARAINILGSGTR